MNKFYPWSAVLVMTLFSFSVAAQISFYATHNYVIEDQSHNDEGLFNSPLFLDPLNGNNDLSESEYTAPLEVSSSCVITKVEFLIKLDLNGDGIVETSIDSENLQAPGELLYNNINGNGTLTSYDTRLVPSQFLYQFAIIFDTLSSGNLSFSLGWASNNSIVPCQFPYGSNIVEWTVYDDCGYNGTYIYEFEVVDKKAPQVFCQNGVSVALMNANPIQVQFWASDLLDYTQDNHTSPADIKTGICFDHPHNQMEDICTGSLPLNPNGTADTLLTLNCLHLGSIVAQLWAEDQSGNRGHCEAIVSVEDGSGLCGISPNVTEFCVYAKSICTPAGQTSVIPDVDIDVIGGSPFLPPVIPVNNCFDISSFPTNGTRSLKPVKDIGVTEGVNTLDLLSIQKHLLGTAIFTNPYVMIAADVNKSGSITPTDIIELRKLLLGIYSSQLPNNTSWRFIDETYVFSNPFNLFVDQFPEIFTPSYLLTDTIWFWGIKTGDVDCSYIPKNSSEPSYLTYTNQKLNSDTEHWIQLKVSDVQALQGTLEFDGAEVLAVQPRENCTADEFHLSEKENAVTFAWFGEGDVLFDVKIRTEKEGSVTEMMRLTDRITPRTALSEDETQTPLELRDDNRRKDLCFAIKSFCPESPAGAHGLEEADFMIGTNIVSQSTGHISNTGEYCFGDMVPNTEVRFLKVDDYLNNVNAYDFLQIKNHLNGTEPFTNIFQFIAADVDGSKSITGADTVELRKLILGIYPTELPNVESWAFIPESYVFPDTMNPFIEPYPTSMHLKDSHLGINYFKGIKIGDLDNCVALINPEKSVESLNTSTWLTANLNRTVSPGEVVELTFASSMDVVAMQGTLKGQGLELLDVIPRRNCDADAFYLNKKTNSVRFAWIGRGKPIFSIKAKALQIGVLSDMIIRDDSQTEWLAFPTHLSAIEKKQSHPKVTVHANPNQMQRSTTHTFTAVALPSIFSEKTTIQIDVPELFKDKKIEVRVFDGLGKLVFEDTSCSSNQCSIDIFKKNLPSAGVYSVHIQVGMEQKIVRIVRQ